MLFLSSSISSSSLSSSLSTSPLCLHQVFAIFLPIFAAHLLYTNILANPIILHIIKDLPLFHEDLISQELVYLSMISQPPKATMLWQPCRIYLRNSVSPSAWLLPNFPITFCPFFISMHFIPSLNRSLLLSSTPPPDKSSSLWRRNSVTCTYSNSVRTPSTSVHISHSCPSSNLFQFLLTLLLILSCSLGHLILPHSSRPWIRFGWRRCCTQPIFHHAYG